MLDAKCRSRARLSMGNITGALADAEEATKIAPKFPQVNTCPVN
jgi:hypothetical protein